MSEPLLRLQGIRRVFRQGGAELEVLKGADFVLPVGRIVALVGPSGAGKSTLLHICGLLEQATAGEVLIDGRPTGRLGDAASYAPLVWSDSAGVYNTTGAATQVYDGKAHNDDYLMLTPDGGHPGRGKYYTVAGYTIQPEDGDGLYRLVSTSLMKSDGVKSKGEDGLDLQVFLNNARLQVACARAIERVERAAGPAPVR